MRKGEKDGEGKREREREFNAAHGIAPSRSKRLFLVEREKMDARNRDFDAATHGRSQHRASSVIYVTSVNNFFDLSSTT